MQYLRARYYDQRTGRFASVDPFEGMPESPISRHRYLYGNDNPVTFSDPSGMFADVLSPGTLTALQAVYLGVIGTTLGTIAAGQFVGSRILSRLRKDVTWDAKLLGISAAIKLAVGTGLRGAVLSASANQATSPIGVTGQERFFSGKWLLVSTGLDLGYGGLSQGEAINSSFKLASPGVFGANPGVLSGATTFAGVASRNRANTFAVIGLGSGIISSFKDHDSDANITLYSGISIPISGTEKPV